MNRNNFFLFFIVVRGKDQGRVRAACIYLFLLFYLSKSYPEKYQSDRRANRCTEEVIFNYDIIEVL